MGLLHKSNIPTPEDLEDAQGDDADDQAEEETKDLSEDDAKKRANKKAQSKKSKKEKAMTEVVNSDRDNLLDVGKIVPEVRVKELNYFDATPILSMMPSVVGSTSLDYKTLTVGAFHKGTIEKVVQEGQKRVILKLGDFVRATLPIEHMADHPLKVIPPKFTEVGKEIKVRVFGIDGRHVELTKKDSLMKDSVQVYDSLNDLKPGMTLCGVVVGKTEHGFVVKSFGGLKGLLKHDDVKEFGVKKLKTTDLKSGSALKAYVQFVKKGKGIALTLSKKKARKNEADDQDGATESESLFTKYLPNDEDIQGIQKSYANLLKKGSSKAITPLEVQTYRVCESRATYHILKSTNLKK